MQLLRGLYSLVFLFITNGDQEVYQYPDFNDRVKGPFSVLPEEYSGFRLGNGLEVIILRHKDLEDAQVSLSVKVGYSGVSPNAPQSGNLIEGLPHLVEHCMFYANDSFLNPHEYTKFVFLSGGYRNALTDSKATNFVLNFPLKFLEKKSYKIFEMSLRRFAAQFISPHFTEKSVLSEVQAVDNEWALNEHTEIMSTDRYAQLFMSKDHPSSMFKVGNQNSLLKNGIGNLVEQVKTFWKTHYTGNNMKLAISVPRYVKNIESLVVELFSDIPSATEEPKVVDEAGSPTTIPFWSPEHHGQTLRVYSPYARRNHLFLYWYISCEHPLCDASLEHLVKQVQKQKILQELGPKQLLARIHHYGGGNYVFVAQVHIRDRELDKIKNFKDSVCSTLDSLQLGGSPSPITFYKSPANPALKLSYAMATGPSIYDAPFIAHVHEFGCNEAIENLAVELLSQVRKESPRVAIQMKSSFIEKLTPEGIAFLKLDSDPYFPFKYRFETSSSQLDDSKISDSTPLPSSSVSLTTTHQPLGYTHQFYRGVYIEMIQIRLKEWGIVLETSLNDRDIVLKVYLPQNMPWKEVIDHVMTSMNSIPLDEVTFIKAKDRQLREMKDIIARKNPNQVAHDYFTILTSTSSNPATYLVSDPNPEQATLKEVAVIGKILHSIENIKKVVADIAESDVQLLNAAEIGNYITRQWSPTASVAGTRFLPINKGETIMYVPPVVSFATNVLHVSYQYDGGPEEVQMIQALLSSHFEFRLRHEIELSYSPEVIFTRNNTMNYLSFIVASPLSPVEIWKNVDLILRHVPSHLRTIPLNNLRRVAQNKKITSFSAIDADGREKIIQSFTRHVLQPVSARIFMIQLWSYKLAALRAQTLSAWRQNLSPRTKLHTSISQYPVSPDIRKQLSTVTTSRDELTQSPVRPIVGPQAIAI